MKFIYRLYQVFIAAPVFLLSTVLTGFVTTVGCLVGNGHFWGYYPGHLWSWVTTHIFLLPVKVEGRENLQKGQSYVFVANHQGAFDIFLIYGYLNRNFKWMMKRALSRVPVIGMACRYSHQIFVDRSSVSRIRETYDKARDILREGMSLVVFPEGARTFTGHLGPLRWLTSCSCLSAPLPSMAALTLCPACAMAIGWYGIRSGSLSTSPCSL